jgi:hypothetical protein
MGVLAARAWSVAGSAIGTAAADATTLDGELKAACCNDFATASGMVIPAYTYVIARSAISEGD